MSQGIGDTIRVSPTGSPPEEDQVGKADFEDAGTSSGWRGSCFMSDLRTHADRPHRSAENQVETLVQGISAWISGCCHGLRGQRTGRGAKEADLGVAGGIGEGLLIRKGARL